MWVVGKAPPHSPTNWGHSEPSRVQWGLGVLGEKGIRGQQQFPVKYCGVKAGKESFVNGSGKVQVERADWLGEENPCQNTSLNGTVFLEKRELTKWKGKRTYVRCTFIFSHEFQKGFLATSPYIFHGLFAICFDLQPMTFENSWKELLPWLFLCNDPGVTLLTSLLVIFTQKLTFQLETLNTNFTWPWQIFNEKKWMNENLKWLNVQVSPVK